MSILTNGTSSSDPSFKPCCRRDFLYTGLIGGLGLSLGSFLKMRDAQARDGVPLKEGVAKSVIHIFMPGGMDAFSSSALALTASTVLSALAPGANMMGIPAEG